MRGEIWRVVAPRIASRGQMWYLARTSHGTSASFFNSSAAKARSTSHFSLRPTRAMSTENGKPSHEGGQPNPESGHHHTLRETAQLAAQRISSTLHSAAEQYEFVEGMVLKHVSEANRRQYRANFLRGLTGFIVLMLLFGKQIRTYFTTTTADLAKETLENESLQMQTQGLASAVVQTILTDPEITAQAAIFLKEASTTQEVQQAMVNLVLHILQHPDTLQEVTALSKKLVADLSADKEVIAKLAQIGQDVVAEPSFKAALVSLVSELCKDPEVMKSVTEMLIAVLSKSSVTDQTITVLQSASTSLLTDEEVKTESRKLVANIMGDDSLQRESGEALWNSVLYALQPGVIRVTGMCLVTVSVAAIRVFLSPF